MTDPAGDAVVDPLVPVAPDLVAGSVQISPGLFTATVTFAPGSFSSLDTVWAIFLDTDENRATGFSDGGLLGWDYAIVGRGNSANIERPGPPGETILIGSTQVTSSGSDQLTVTFPMGLLGDDDGRLAFFMVCTQITARDPGNTGDRMPDLNRSPGRVR